MNSNVTKANNNNINNIDINAVEEEETPRHSTRIAGNKLIVPQVQEQVQGRRLGRKRVNPRHAQRMAMEADLKHLREHYEINSNYLKEKIASMEEEYKNEKDFLFNRLFNRQERIEQLEARLEAQDRLLSTRQERIEQLEEQLEVEAFEYYLAERVDELEVQASTLEDKLEDNFTQLLDERECNRALRSKIEEITKIIQK